MRRRRLVSRYKGVSGIISYSRSILITAVEKLKFDFKEPTDVEKLFKGYCKRKVN